MAYHRLLNKNNIHFFQFLKNKYVSINVSKIIIYYFRSELIISKCKDIQELSIVFD
jgi:hypothetical protein